MFKIFSGSAVAAALFAVASVTAIDASPAHAYACKSSPHQAIAVRNVRQIAVIAAQKNWTNSVKTQFGLSWSVWSIASNASNNCAKLSNGKWRCLASAKPCNYVVQ